MSLAEAMPHHPVTPTSSTSGSSVRDSGVANLGTAASANAKQQKDVQAFEFTKRKRWADLLVTELSEAIVLVLSSACKVWYCGAAVTELLGWKDEELVDGDITDLMNQDDRTGFHNQFRECAHTRGSMLAYARLQCKNEFYMANDYSSRPREVLFEITGKPHYFPGTDEFKCFFAVAKPYPSRNTAMLNTFLELKMENERLQQRVTYLRAHAKALNTTYPSASPASSASPTPTQFSQVSHRGGDGYYNTYDDALPSGSAQGYDGGAASSYDLEEDGADPNGARKKIKRTFGSTEQYVCQTCGRTDSPEWRKGPAGPKTLCNACGLRWAKKLRTDKSNEAAGGNPDASGDSVF